jgi:DNA-binding NarL/FixJ family response regulator
MVESLLDKSLIRRLPGDEETAEFSMLESLREYAADQLASHGEAEKTRARHAGHYAGLAAQFEASIGLPEERTWVLRAGRHHADLRAALDYCLGARRDAWALLLAAALGWYHYTRGDLGHGQALVDAVLPLTAGRHDPAGMSDDATAGGQAGVLIVAGILAWATGETRRAQDLLLSALERSEEHGDARRAAIACAFLGHVARAGGEWDASADWHRRAEAGFREGGNTQGVAWARHDLGLLARDHGDLESAAELLRASLRDFRELDYPWAVAWSAWGLGTTLSAQGRLEEACPLLAEALRIYTGVNDPRGVAQCLEALAYVASERAHYESAARLIGAAAALRVRVTARQPDTEQARNSAVERVLARALGAQVADTLTHAGRTMPAQQAADLAMAVALGAAPGDQDRSHQVPLTPRERQVAALVASGRTNRQIGRALGISEKTAEVHLHHVMSKLDARSRAEVAAWAVTHHLSPPARQASGPR